MFYIIYKTTNTVNGKIYIGKHMTEKLEDGYLGSGVLLNHAIKKYGKEFFVKEILHIFDNEEDMNAKENELVTEDFILSNQTYNLTIGGSGGPAFKGRTHTKESKKKISETKKGKTLSKETKDKLSKKLKGRTRSEETKARMSKPKSDEHKEKIRNAALNRSPELQKKMTEAATGWTHSEESKDKMRHFAKNRPDEHIKKIGEAIKGRRFYFNPITGKTIFTKESCPEGFLPGRYTDYVKKKNESNE